MDINNTIVAETGDGNCIDSEIEEEKVCEANLFNGIVSFLSLKGKVDKQRQRYSLDYASEKPLSSEDEEGSSGNKRDKLVLKELSVICRNAESSYSFKCYW